MVKKVFYFDFFFLLIKNAFFLIIGRQTFMSSTEEFIQLAWFPDDYAISW
jgi:hypothetical protein